VCDADPGRTRAGDRQAAPGAAGHSRRPDRRQLPRGAAVAERPPREVQRAVRHGRQRRPRPVAAGTRGVRGAVGGSPAAPAPVARRARALGSVTVALRDSAHGRPRMMLRSILGLVLSVLAVTPASAADPIRIGYLGPLTGIFAPSGKDML